MKNLNRIGQIFSDISNAKGTNQKKEIIKDTLNDNFLKEDFELCLKHLYDPMVITGISKTSWKSAVDLTSSYSDEHLDEFPDIKTFLDYLHNNNTGKKETVITCAEMFQHYVCLFQSDAKWLLYCLVTKDINIGISTTTVRKYVNIPKFEIMLGSRLDENVDFDKSFILSQKLDGINLTCIKRNENDIQFITRQGKFIDGLLDLKREYESLPNGVYFGEALYHGRYIDRKHLFRLSSGELNSKSSDKKIEHHIFDYQTLEEWDSNNFVTPYKNTVKFIKEHIIGKDFLNIFSVNFIYEGTGKKEAMELLDTAKKNDWEGLVLRYSSSVYEKIRSKNFVKLKPMSSIDLKIIGYKEHKHKNKLGSFIVDYKGNQVSVGSGYTDEERVDFWNNKEEMIGKIIEIQFMDFSEDKEGNKSLRLPVFLRLREDKSEISLE